MRRFLPLVVLLVAAPLLAGGTIETRTRVHFGAGGAKLIKRAVGPETKDGLTRKTAIQSRRLIDVVGSKGNLIDLDKQELYEVNLSRKRFTVRTFEEERDRIRGFVSEAKIEGDESFVPGMSYAADVSTERTGGSGKYGGYECIEHRITVVVTPEGQTLAEAGGGILTADVMIGPDLHVFNEVEKFRRDYLDALGLEAAEDETGKRLASILAGAPALKLAMERFDAAHRELPGSSMRIEIRLETVPPPALVEEEADGEQPDKLRHKIGRGTRNVTDKFLVKRAERREDKLASKAEGRTLVFRSTTEVMSVSSSAQGLTRLAGFKQK